VGRSARVTGGRGGKKGGGAKAASITAPQQLEWNSKKESSGFCRAGEL